MMLKSLRTSSGPYSQGKTRASAAIKNMPVTFRHHGSLKRQNSTVAYSSDFNAAGAFMDLASLVASSGSGGHTPYDSLADKIGQDCYVDVNGWHLYLRDVKIPGGNFTLAQGLAQQLGPEVQGKGARGVDYQGLLKKVPMKFGGGKVTLPLNDVMPSGCMKDLEQICEQWERNL